MANDLDDFVGNTDDDKLDKALAAAAGTWLDLTYSRPLTLTKHARAPFRGVIQGRGRGTPITISGFDSRTDGVGLFHAGSALVKQMQFRDVCVKSNSPANGPHQAFLTQDKSSPGFQQLLLHSVQASGLWGVAGTASQRLLLTACTFSGPDWDVNNGWHTAFYMGGSDNVFWPDGLLLDSPGVPDGNGHEPATATPHLRVGYMDKSSFGRIYCTATGRWYGLLFEGQTYNSGSAGGNSGPCTFDSPVFEGRNKSTPCYDAVVKVTGGQPIFHGGWFGYAMFQPDGSFGTVHCTGGYTRIHSPSYGNASGVSPDVPFLYATGDGTNVRITDGTVGTQAGKWPDPKPRYRAVSRASVRADATFVKLS